MSQTRIAPLAFMFLFIISTAAAATAAAEHTGRQHHNTNCEPGGASEHRPTRGSRTLKAATSSKSCSSRPPLFCHRLEGHYISTGRVAFSSLSPPGRETGGAVAQHSTAQHSKPACALHKCDPFEQITAVIAFTTPPPPTLKPPGTRILSRFGYSSVLLPK